MPPDKLGVTAIDDYTLEVRLSQPTPYLLTVLAGTAYMPLRREFVEAQQDRYGADAKNLLSNGPFQLDDWIHNASMTLSKNQQYWASNTVKLSNIDIGYITSDTRSLFNLYKTGELASLRLDENVLKDASRDKYRVRKAPTNCLAWLILNLRDERPTNNLKLRQAIRMAFDRDRYTNNIVGLPGIRKIDSIFTRRIRGIKGSFQAEFPAPQIEFNLKKARQLLAEAEEELGGEIPPLILLANETRQIEAEFIQSQLQSALGLTIRVDKQTFKQAIAKMQQGRFDIARAGYCGGALLDPVFFAGIFDSSSPFNDGAYGNDRYDALMQVTHSTADAVVRMNAFAEMQQRLYEDIPIIPTHESAWIYLQDDRVDGFIRYPVVNFSRGYIAM
jgi:oligopeptide transport system substrate-binding protein